MGVGQQMPATAQALSARIGLPFQPGLLAGTDAASRDYQNAITDAAAQEAWKAAKGNPRVAAMYYHGGSNRSGWGPKTHAYADKVLAQMGAN